MSCSDYEQILIVKVNETLVEMTKIMMMIMAMKLINCTSIRRKQKYKLLTILENKSNKLRQHKQYLKYKSGLKYLIHMYLLHLAK